MIMEHKRNLSLALVLILAFFVAIIGCKKDEAESKKSAGPTELEGIWNAACKYDAGKSNMDKINSLTFSGNSAHNYDKYYDTTNDSCSTLALVQDGIMSFALSGAIDATSGIKKIDYVLLDITYTPKSADGVIIANEDCSGDVHFNNPEETKSVLGTHCDHWNQKKNTTFYSVYKLNTTASPNILHKGDMSTDVAGRPTTVDASKDYVKQ
jgi:hypothetical protein